MTDPLLPREPLPSLPVTPGQVESALGRVHARRRRTALLSSSAVVALALAVGAGADLPGRRDALDIAPTTGLAEQVASADPTPSAAGVSSGRSAAPTAGPRTAAPLPTPTVGIPPGAGSPEPQPSTQPAQPPARGYRRRPPVTRSVEQSQQVQASEGTGSVRSSGCVTLSWCAAVNASTSGRTITLTLRVCRDRTSQPASLHFDSQQELDLSIRRDSASGPEVWRWSAGQRFRADEHWVDVAGGYCARWSLTWDGVLDTGERIPAGDYLVVGRSLAAEVAELRPDHPLEVRG